MSKCNFRKLSIYLFNLGIPYNFNLINCFDDVELIFISKNVGAK